MALFEMHQSGDRIVLLYRRNALTDWYAFRFKSNQFSDVVLTASRFARNKDLDFSWRDAIVMSIKIRKERRQIRHI